MSTAYQVRSNLGELYQRRQPIKSSGYLRFIRSLPCCACGGTRNVEAMHVGPRGMSQKVDDKDALPGCRFCHKELHQVGPVSFAAKYALDFAALIAKLNTFFESNLRGTY
jgi:hypothetical protein